MIDWKLAQTRLTAAGHPPGAVDGSLGPATMTAMLSCVARRTPDDLMRALGASMAAELPRHGITETPRRLASFLGETACESGGYAHLEENMHYSARRLMQIWPGRFPTLASAAPYAWDPSDPDREDVALANLVYGHRMGNELNGTQDSDGWDHRGRGLLQHTGAEEYRLLQERLHLSPDDVATPTGAVLAACDFWERRGLSVAADRGDVAQERRLVNGGTIGFAEVARYRDRALQILA